MLAGHIGELSVRFLRQLDVAADLFLCHVDGWWEVYTGRPAWFDRLRSAWADCVVRPLERAGSPRKQRLYPGWTTQGEPA
jgi:hypothetical protein